MASARSISLERLFAEPLIGGETGTGTATLLREAMGGRLTLPPMQLTFGNTEGVKRAVAAGLGVSLVLRSSCLAEVVSDRLRALRIRGTRLRKSFYLVRRDDSLPSVLTDTICKHLLGDSRENKAASLT